MKKHQDSGGFLVACSSWFAASSMRRASSGEGLLTDSWVSI